MAMLGSLSFMFYNLSQGQDYVNVYSLCDYAGQ